MAGDDGVAARALFPTRAASTPLIMPPPADLERTCRPDAILATNTSTIDVELIAAKTQAADRIVGAHFFSPAHVMPLLEIVRTPKTSKQASRAGRGWVERRQGWIGLGGVEGPSPGAAGSGVTWWAPPPPGCCCTFSSGD